jgi:choline dehydrogenase-like flavoprotein
MKAEENISAIKEVTIKNYAGKQHTVKAKHFILACCAIQNARLLLVSNTQAPAGIGNDHDLVGRYFMEHIEITTGELWLNDSDSLDLYKFGKKVRAELAVSAKKQEELEILHATISLWPLEVSKKLKPWVTTWQEDDPRKSLKNWDKFYSGAQKKSLLKRILSSSKHKSYGLFTRSEQAPNPSSRVKLGMEKDSLGVPRADLSWVMAPIDKRTIRKTNELLGQLVGTAGIGRVKLADFLWDESDVNMPSFISGGWHHMGTTRMSDDPNNGVVDANCKVHGISNLFVAGSSCYATGSAVNPTYTIVAISLRLSDHIKEVIKR